MSEIDRLNKVLTYTKQAFVGKDEIIDLLGIALVARENIFLLGPPGTAKSAIIRQISSCIKDGKNFEYLLTRFTEPNEIFGPFDIRKLREGELTTNTEGMMPEASLVFLDEIFNANSAILNSLLMALNEKIFRRGKETIKLPALCFAGASNGLPEDEALAALLDRFLIRVKCDYVEPELLEDVLEVGWNHEKPAAETAPTIERADIMSLQAESKQVNIRPVRKAYIDLVRALRSSGIKVSDRRAVKIQNLVAASAVICGRKEAIASDLWVFKYVWDTVEQVEVLTSMVNSVLQQEEEGEKVHPQASFDQSPDPEELMKEVELLTQRWNKETTTAEEKNLIKDKLRYVQSRSQWIGNELQKAHLSEAIEALWNQMLNTA